MTLSSQPLPQPGAPNATEDPKVRGLLSELQGIVNGNIDSSNVLDASLAEADLNAALATRLGLGTAGRGKSIIATSENRTNPAYGTLPTPDKVTVTLPSNGLIAIAFHAVWQESVVGAGAAAFFIGPTQLKLATTAGSPAPQETAPRTSGPNIYGWLSSGVGGIFNGDSNYSGLDVTTGQVVGGLAATTGGGPCYVFAAAGTYDVTVQFKASSGTVAAQDRKLWVWTMGF